MAKKPMSNQKPKSDKSETKVTRITAKDSVKTAKVEPKSAKTGKTIEAKVKSKAKKEKPAKKIGYFRGAWEELKQVRWPNRAETWKMTAGLLLFCAFFIVFILSADILFQYLFRLLIG